MTDTPDTVNTDDLLHLTTDIVAAYVSNNIVEPDALPALISDVFERLKSVSEASLSENAAELALVPAVPVNESVTDAEIICLEDGLPFKSLKRHLRAKYNLTPAEYRAKWGLPQDYPMVAPDYARKRSKLAKKSGLGRHPSSDA